LYPSVALHVTVVVPTGNTTSLEGLQVTVREPLCASVAVGLVYETTAPPSE